MKDASAAIIGLGYWGPNVVRNVIDTDSFDNIYCYDIDKSRFGRIKKRFPSIKFVENYDAILENESINCVFICTPPVTHCQLAREALIHNKNVLVEKPMTVSVKEAKELIKISNEKSSKLMVGHTFEYSPAVEKIKEIIDSGMLGEIYFITMTRINLGIHRKDVSVIYDLATHDFSILFKLINEMPEKISAIANSFVKKGQKDVAFINVKYTSGIIVNINVSWLSPKKVREIIIVGRRKMLIYDDTKSDEKIKIFDKGVELLKDPDNYGEYQLTYRTGDVFSPVLRAVEPLRLEIDHFIDCVNNGLNPKTDGYCGLKVVKAVEAAEKSSEKDGEVIIINEE